MTRRHFLAMFSALAAVPAVMVGLRRARPVPPIDAGHDTLDALRYICAVDCGAGAPAVCTFYGKGADGHWHNLKNWETL